MQISITALVILSIMLFVLPMAAVIWVFLRTEAMRTDASLAVKAAEASDRDVILLKEYTAQLENKSHDTTTGIHELKAAVRSLEESLRTVNNKLSSRERAERRAAAEVPLPEPEKGVETEPDGDQTIIDFPGFGPQTNPQPAAAMPRKRKFGEQP